MLAFQVDQQTPAAAQLQAADRRMAFKILADGEKIVLKLKVAAAWFEQLRKYKLFERCILRL